MWNGKLQARIPFHSVPIGEAHIVKAVISYSNKDEPLRNELESHLSMLKRSGVMETWHNRRSVAGTELNAAISEQLESAEVILPLVSSDFLASNNCYDVEMGRALELHAQGRAVVAPIILRPCDWLASPFGGLMASPPDGLPVTKFPNQDEAFTNIVKDIRRVADRFCQPVPAPERRGQESMVASGGLIALRVQSEEGGAQAERSSNLRVMRKFNDHERDAYIENAYEYMARFFEESLGELHVRNPQISTNFTRIDANSFTSTIYENGQRVSCG